MWYDENCHVSLWFIMDYSPPGTSVHGIFQARILEWVAISYSRGSSRPRDQTFIYCVYMLAGGFFAIERTWGAPWIESYIMKTVMHLYGLLIA